MVFLMLSDQYKVNHGTSMYVILYYRNYNLFIFFAKRIFFDNFRGRPKSATGYKNKVHRWDEMHIELINHETFIF